MDKTLGHQIVPANDDIFLTAQGRTWRIAVAKKAPDVCRGFKVAPSEVPRESFVNKADLSTDRVVKALEELESEPGAHGACLQGTVVKPKKRRGDKKSTGTR